MSRQVLALLVRFAAIYAALVALCAVLPAYVWIERAVTAAAAVPLAERAQVARSLSFEPRADPPAYVYELRVGAVAREIRRAYHKHGFLLVLVVALVLATPGLGAKRGALLFAAGAAAGFLLCVLLLMSDVEAWEHAALAQANLGALPGPYPIPLGFLQGLHRTAAAGLLPVGLWALFVSRRAASHARTPHATSRA